MSSNNSGVASSRKSTASLLSGQAPFVGVIFSGVFGTNVDGVAGVLGNFGLVGGPWGGVGVNPGAPGCFRFDLPPWPGVRGAADI